MLGSQGGSILKIFMCTYPRRQENAMLITFKWHGTEIEDLLLSRCYLKSSKHNPHKCECLMYFYGILAQFYALPIIHFILIATLWGLLLTYGPQSMGNGICKKKSMEPTVMMGITQM